MTDSDHQDLLDYYNRGREQDRLADGVGRLEFERTIEIMRRALPATPALIADIGGGAGRYAVWLADHGYTVEHRDIAPIHVEQLREAAGDGSAITSAVGDARSLDLEDQRVDAVLLLGPLYHLRSREDRLAALREARRILVPGGVVFVAAVSRWSVRMDGALCQRLYRVEPGFDGLIEQTVATGWLRAGRSGAFTAYTHRPDDLRDEITLSGLVVEDLVAVEGPSGLVADVGERMDDEVDRRVLMDASRALERVPELLGATPHLLATARRLNG